MKKIIIVGAGLSGLTAASILANKYKVDVFEQRDHIGGNCYDYILNDTLVHKYGPHIFHTNNKEVWKFVNKYSKFNNYKHTVHAITDVGLFPVPFNKTSEKTLGRNLSDREILNYIFKNYSKKMWGLPWEKLSKDIRCRVKLRSNNDTGRYFDDVYQGMPVNGYTQLFKNMIDNKNISVHCDCRLNEWKKYDYDLLIYTGRLDEFFNKEYGKLAYRSLYIEFSEHNLVAPLSAVYNDCTENSITRTTYFDVFYGSKYKYSCCETPIECKGDCVPYYPINFGNNLKTVNKYKQLTYDKNIIIGGRLGLNKYLNMDTAISEMINILKGRK